MKINHQPHFTDQLKKGLADKGLSTRSIVAFLIFGMIVLVFVLSDISGRNGGTSSMGTAAEVNGELITLKDFTEEESKMSQYYSQLFGGQFDVGAQRALLRGEVMNSLVSKTLASQAAEKEGIYATDAEVRHMVVNELPYFKKDGQFQTDAYKAILQANKLTPGEFENKLRQDIKNQRSRQLFESSMMVSDLQKNTEKELRSSKLNVDYIQLSGSEFAKSNPVSSDVIAKKMADETFKKKVEEDFNSNKAQYEVPEQVKASHILIKAAADDVAARKKAEEILKRVQKEDFGKVASAVSDDPGSKLKKGDLGFFSRGKMIKEFEDVAFALPVGKVSEIVKTNFGYHIIKVTDKKATSHADFDKAKNEIAQKLINNENYAGFIKKVEELLALGKSDEASQLILSNKMQWKETGFFDLSNEVVPVINSAQAMKVALQLNKSKPLAAKLVREGDAQFLLKLKDMKFESTDLKAQEQDMLEKQKSTEAYRSWVDSFKKSAKVETNTDLIQQPQ